MAKTVELLFTGRILFCGSVICFYIPKVDAAKRGFRQMYAGAIFRFVKYGPITEKIKLPPGFLSFLCIQAKRTPLIL